MPPKKALAAPAKKISPTQESLMNVLRKSFQSYELALGRPLTEVHLYDFENL